VENLHGGYMGEAAAKKFEGRVFGGTRFNSTYFSLVRLTIGLLLKYNVVKACESAKVFGTRSKELPLKSRSDKYSGVCRKLSGNAANPV
jgi:hypothetical protein